MLTEQTTDRLRRMRLAPLAEAWLRQQEDPSMAELSFDERFGLLVEALWVAKENKRMERNMKVANLRLPQACVEAIDYAPERKLNRDLVRRLINGRWVTDHRNIVIVGATGTGKTFLGCAFAQLAIRQGKKAVYRRASRLFNEMRLAHADGSIPRLLDRLAKVDVLVLDDLGMAPLTELQRHDLLEILDDRVSKRSTIVSTQLPVKHWHEVIGDPTVADAVCDRVLHAAYRIELKGPSRRPRQPPSDVEGQE